MSKNQKMVDKKIDELMAWLLIYLGEGIESSDIDEIEKLVRECIFSCLTGQEEFSIFQHEQQAKKTTRS